jgi:hypothetical protein
MASWWACATLYARSGFSVPSGSAEPSTGGNKDIRLVPE